MKLSGLPKTKKKEIKVPKNLQSMVLEVIQWMSLSDLVWDKDAVGDVYMYSHMALGKCCMKKESLERFYVLYGKLKADGFL